MATFFSNQIIWYWGSTAYPVRGTLTGNVSRSGNTVTLSGMNLALSWPPYASGTWSVSFTVNGTTTSRSMSANTANFGVNNTSFGVGATETSHTVGWSSSDGYSGSFVVTFPSGATSPSGGSVTYNSCTWNSVNITSKVSSWGSGYSGTPNLEQIVVNSGATSSNWQTKGRIVKQNATSGTSSTQSVTNANASLVLDGGITVKGCTSFKVAMWGSTNIGNTNAFDNTTRYTPPAPLQSFIVGTQSYAGNNRANIPLTIVGGTSTNNNNVNVDFQYRTNINNQGWGAWTSMGSGTPWTSKTATITVACNASVQAQARQVYQSQASETKSVSTTAIKAPATTYVSVNGKSKKAQKAYISVGGKAKKVTKIYTSVNGKSKLVYTG